MAWGMRSVRFRRRTSAEPVRATDHSLRQNSAFRPVAVRRRNRAGNPECAACAEKNQNSRRQRPAERLGRDRPCGIRFTIRSAVPVLSTIAAALPVVSLLVLIASGRVKAHLAALIALVLAILVAIFVFTMPAGSCAPRGDAWRRHGLLPDRLDHPQRHLSLPADGRDGRVRTSCRRRSAASRATGGCSCC